MINLNLVQPDWITAVIPYHPSLHTMNKFEHYPTLLAAITKIKAFAHLALTELSQHTVVYSNTLNLFKHKFQTIAAAERALLREPVTWENFALLADGKIHQLYLKENYIEVELNNLAGYFHDLETSCAVSISSIMKALMEKRVIKKSLELQILSYPLNKFLINQKIINERLRELPSMEDDYLKSLKHFVDTYPINITDVL